MRLGIRITATCLCWLLCAEAGRAERVLPIAKAPRSEAGRFLNYVGEIDEAGPTVTLPFFWRRLLGGFRSSKGAPERHRDPAAQLRQLLDGEDDFVFWIGHASVLVRQDAQIFLTDPVWSRSAGPGGIIGAARLSKPALPIEALPRIDFLLISHNHYDHLDRGSLKALAERNPDLLVLAPLEHRRTLNGLGIELIELDWGDTWNRAGIEVVCLPAQHWSRRGLFDKQRSLWSSWATLGSRSRFYFGGDTGFFPELKDIGETLGPFELAALPIGAYEPTEMMRPYHMDPEESLEAAQLLGAKNVMGIHYGTFDLTDEPLAEPPERFLKAGPEAGYTRDQLWLLKIGGGRSF